MYQAPPYFHRAGVGLDRVGSKALISPNRMVYEQMAFQWLTICISSVLFQLIRLEIFYLLSDL